MLHEEDIRCFNALKFHLIEDLDPTDVLFLLRHHNVISEEEACAVVNNVGDDIKSKARQLVEILSYNLPSYDLLINVLERARYNWLVSLARRIRAENSSPPQIISNGIGEDGLNNSAEVNNNLLAAAAGDCQQNKGAVVIKEEERVEIVKPARKSTDSLYLASRGKIPKRPDVYVHRSELFERLKNLLSTLEHQRGWIFVHGMAGSGKSVLSAEVVRDQSILGQIFPQVFWISFDGFSVQPSSSSLPVVDRSPSTDEKSTLLAKLHFLYSHVAHLSVVGRQESQRASTSSSACVETLTSVEDALLKLPDLLLKHYPRVLLVLDGVNSKYHVTKFDELCCRYLVTTRDENLAYCINGYKEIMPVNPSGFTRQETREAFGKWLKCPVDDLPRLADDFYEETNGHPFFIGLLGSLLRIHKNRWSYYYNELRQSGLTGIVSHTSVNAYKHKSFHDAVVGSLSDLPDRLKVKYLQLSIFPLKTKIPALVLAIYWNLDVEKLEAVEDLMDQLVLTSFVVRQTDDAGRYDSYVVHTLMHRWLQIIVGPNTLKEYHRQLLRNYETLVDGNWGSLPNDNYIHNNIRYHVEMAGRLDLLAPIFFNVKFLHDKVNLCAGYDKVLDEFNSIEKHLSIEDFDKFIAFQKFLVKNQQSKRHNLLSTVAEEPANSLIRRESVNKYFLSA